MTPGDFSEGRYTDPPRGDEIQASEPNPPKISRGDPAPATPPAPDPGKNGVEPGGNRPGSIWPPAPRIRGVRLRIRLVLLIVLALLPSLALLIQTASEERRIIATSVEEGVLRLVRPVTAELERLLGGTRQLLLVLARLPEVRRFDSRGASALLADLREHNPLYANIGAVRPDGTVFASALAVPQGINLRDRPWFQRAVATKDFAVGDFQIGRITGKASLNVAYPLLGKDGSVEAVLFAALDLAYLGSFAADLALPPGSVLFILDRHGTVLVRHPGNREKVGSKFADDGILSEILVRQYGVLEARGSDGEDRVYAFAPLIESPDRAPNAFVAIGVSRELAYREADLILTRNLGLLAIVWTLLLGIVLFGTERLLMRPVDRLMAATRALAAGKLDVRVDGPYQGDELGELARAFDTMAANLQAMTAQREAAIREEQATQAEAAALKNLDRLRTQFVNAVSHELRIPLTSIIGYTEFLEDGLGGPLTAKQAEFVAQIRQGALRLSRLVDDLLDFARLEAGTFALRLEKADFCAKVREVLESFQPQAQEAGLDLSATLPPEPVIVQMDAHRVGQILSNLVGNAIKFTGPGGRITVSVQVRDGWVRCEVADTGPGIAEEDLPRLFKPFSQLGAGKKMGGTGLGLSITRSLVEAHGGRVGVRSKLGEGSVFWFELPLEQPQASPPEGGPESELAEE